MKKCSNYIFLVEFMPGGKGEDVDTAEIAVRSIFNELLDRTYRLRLCRLPQNSKEVFGFAGKSHVTIRLITVAVTVFVGKRKASDRSAVVVAWPERCFACI